MHVKKGMLKRWHKGTHTHHISPLRETRRFMTCKKDRSQKMGLGGIRLDASNMGGGKSTVGIALKQVHSGLDGTNYSERVDPLVHEGFTDTMPPTRK